MCIVCMLIKALTMDWCHSQVFHSNFEKISKYLKNSLQKIFSKALKGKTLFAMC